MNWYYYPVYHHANFYLHRRRKLAQEPRLYPPIAARHNHGPQNIGSPDSIIVRIFYWHRVLACFSEFPFQTLSSTMSSLSTSETSPPVYEISDSGDES